MKQEKILLYHMPEEKEKKIRGVMKPLRIMVQAVTPRQYEEAVGNIALGNASGENKMPTGPIFGTRQMGEMAVFSGITSERMDEVLRVLKEEKISIALKAVVTMHNFGWDGYTLYQELEKERESYGK